MGPYLVTFTDGSSGIFTMEDIVMLIELGLGDQIVSIVDLSAPPPEPTPPSPGIGASQFTSIRVEMSPYTYEPTDSVAVDIYYRHIGASQIVTLYAAVGVDHPAWLGGFDEKRTGQQTITVPEDAQETEREAIIGIPLGVIPAGTYDVYAKIIDGVLVISNIAIGVVTVTGPPQPAFSGFAISQYNKV